MKIDIKNLTFKYSDIEIFKNFNLSISEGEFVCLLGQSGSGKSTLLRIIAGLEEPYEGEILINGEDTQFQKEDISMVFQDYTLFPWFTIGKNIFLSLKEKYPEKSKKEIEEIILYYLDKVGLSKDVFQKYPFELSGGMKQRCAICQAFALGTEIMLLDEPFGALDAVNRFRLQNLITELWVEDKNNKRTIVFVTHDVDEALLLSTNLYVLGRRPCNIIHSLEKEKQEIYDRDEFYTNPYFTEERDKILKKLYLDVEKRITEEDINEKR